MPVYPTKSCDRVWETDTVTGTGTLNLGAAPATGGYRTFNQAYAAAQLASGDLVRYGIRDTTTYEWELGLGTYTNGSPSTLSRTIVFQSSSSNGLVSFAGNSCDVWIDANASKIDQGILPFLAGNWYTKPAPGGSNANYSNVLHAMPLQWRGPATPVKIGASCTTAPTAAVDVYVGIYDGTTGVPTKLLTSGADFISFSATGLVTVTLSSPPVIDVPNVFLVAGIPSTTVLSGGWLRGNAINASYSFNWYGESEGFPDGGYKSDPFTGFYGYFSTTTYSDGTNLPATFGGVTINGNFGLCQLAVLF